MVWPHWNNTIFFFFYLGVCIYIYIYITGFLPRCVYFFRSDNFMSFIFIFLAHFIFQVLSFSHSQVSYIIDLHSLIIRNLDFKSSSKLFIFTIFWIYNLFICIFFVIRVSNYNIYFKIAIFMVIIMVEFQEICGIYCIIWKNFISLILVNKGNLSMYLFFFFFIYICFLILK